MAATITATKAATTYRRPPGHTSVALSPGSHLPIFTAHLKRKFTAEIIQDPRAFKKAALHYLRLRLPPGPGRAPEVAVTKAIELRNQGTPWPAIYPIRIPDYLSLTPAERSQAASRLRTARRARINTRKRRARTPRPLTRAQLESRKAKAVRFTREVVGDPDRAAQIQVESLRDYAARRHIQLTNPG